MRRYAIILIQIFLSITVKGQQTLPGGVKGVFLWNMSVSLSKQQNIMASKLNNISDSFPKPITKAYSLNSNPAIAFDGNNCNKPVINIGELKGYTMFTVCQPLDTFTEESILTLENDSATDLVVTNQRLASIKECKYANYNKESNDNARIYSYTSYNSRDTNNRSKYLRFGQTPRHQQLPIKALNGIVPEIILFNRNLSFNDRVKVESYLAIKYGISLNQTFPVSYLNSGGEIIWDAAANAQYAQNIAGIGRDDVSGLNQSVTESLHTPGLMKISVAQKMHDKDFVIWGDNGGELQFSEQNNLRKCLNRYWKINVNKTSHIPVTLETHTSAIDMVHPLESAERLWLMVDKSGTGHFPFGKTDYFRFESRESLNQKLLIQNFSVDSDSSGSDVFTFIAMPSLFSRSSCILPDCKHGKTGIIQTEIAGGTPPFKVRITGSSGSSVVNETTVQERLVNSENIVQGNYKLIVTDALNNTFSEEIWVSNSKSWENEINTKYIITEGETLELDASKNMPLVNYTYRWIMPDGSYINSSKIDISKPGNYILNVNDGSGCDTKQRVSIAMEENEDIENVAVFPNPVTNKWFDLRIGLRNKMDVLLTITDTNGKTIELATLKNDHFYWYHGFIKDPGMYILNISAGKSKKSFKLLVQHTN